VGNSEFGLGQRPHLGFSFEAPISIPTRTQPPPPASWSPPAKCAAGAGGEDGEPHGPACEEHPWDEPAEPHLEDCAIKSLPEHLVEGAVLRAHRGDAGRQGHGARSYRRHLRRDPQAHSVPLPRAQDAADPARQGHRRRVHQERGLQVVFLSLLFISNRAPSCLLLLLFFVFSQLLSNSMD
jgi:hypothetical protein